MVYTPTPIPTISSHLIPVQMSFFKSQQKRLQSELEEKERRHLLRLQEQESRELSQPSSLFAWQPAFSTLRFR